MGNQPKDPSLNDDLTKIVQVLNDTPSLIAPKDLKNKIFESLERETPIEVSWWRLPLIRRSQSLITAAALSISALSLYQLKRLSELPVIETASIQTGKDTTLSIGFDAEETVEQVTFKITLPSGLQFIDEKDQPLLAQEVSWKGKLTAGKTMVPIVVRGVKPGRYPITAMVEKGNLKRITTITVPVTEKSS
jgi:hypothetical protein